MMRKGWRLDPALVTQREAKDREHAKRVELKRELEREAFLFNFRAKAIAQQDKHHEGAVARWFQKAA